MYISKIYIPSLQREVQLKQFNNFVYKQLLKQIATKDTDLLSTFIDNLIEQHVFEQHVYTFVDKLTILLNLRCLSVSELLEHSFTKDTSTQKFRYNIYDVINKVVNTKLPTYKVITIRNVEVTLGLPTRVFPDFTDISEFVHKVTSNSKQIDLISLSTNDRQTIVNLLPGELYEHVIQYSKEIIDTIFDVELLHIRTNVDDKTTIPVKMLIDKQNALNLISLFFNDSMINVMMKQFVLSKEHGISCEYFDSLPPIETEILYGFHKEIEQANKEQQKPQGVMLPGNVPVE